MNFKAVSALPKTAHSAQTHKSIRFTWIVWSTLYVYLCHPPTYLRKFSLHKVRENCHFLDHPPTPMSLRYIKMAPSSKSAVVLLEYIFDRAGGSTRYTTEKYLKKSMKITNQTNEWKKQNYCVRTRMKTYLWRSHFYE